MSVFLRPRAGMSALELLIAVTSIGLLLLFVVILINRSLALEHARDLTRFNDVQLLNSSLLQYQIDNHGKLPASLEAAPDDWYMVGIDGDVCTAKCPNQPQVRDCLFLGELVPKYLPRIPQDPFFTALGPSGYYIHKEIGRAVTVGACDTEALPMIEQKQ